MYLSGTPMWPSREYRMETLWHSLKFFEPVEDGTSVLHISWGDLHSHAFCISAAVSQCLPQLHRSYVVFSPFGIYRFQVLGKAFLYSWPDDAISRFLYSGHTYAFCQNAYFIFGKHLARRVWVALICVKYLNRPLLFCKSSQLAFKFLG